MSRFTRIIATLWLLMQLVAALPAPIELLRIPRYVWDTDLAKRDPEASQAAADGAVKPSDHEKFVWASSNKPGEKAVVVSMVAWSKQDERILDMDKFSFAIESASCNEDDMSLTFIHPFIYYAAKAAWEWVNFNDMRSFILVASSDKCGRDKSHDPWVVRSVTFNDNEKRVEMDATKSTWKKVMNTFILDFGEVVVGEGDHWDRSMIPEKRDIIPDLDAKFRLDIGATLPEQIFLWEVHKGVLDGNLTANCNECGTQGALVFAGHVEASLGWTGFDVDRFEISVKPDNVALHIGLSLEFLGHFDFRRIGKPSEEINLLEIPVSGWNIPGIFHFGPQINLNAGYEISYISGHAEASTGISVKIPDSAIAKLDLLNEDSVQVSGWTPQVETEPLEVEVMLDAEASIYTEVALAVSLTVLDDLGFGVDLGLKVPEVTVTVAGGFDSAGFCPNDPDPFGVKIEAMVGADLDLEGWKEVDGNKEELFEVNIFEKPDIFTFPPVCFSFGEISEGYCLPKEPAEDDDDDDDLAGNFRRDYEQPTGTEQPALTRTINELVPRQGLDGRVYPIKCNSSCKAKLLSYPYPTELDQYVETPIPIIIPDVPCADAEGDCKPNTGITVKTTKDKNAVARIDNTSGNEKRAKRWNSEHIYEGNWAAEFMNYAQKNIPGSSDGECHQSILNFWEEYDDLTYDVPKGADRKASYIQAFMQQLGNDFTQERMALVQMRINNIKHLMFREDRNLVSKRRQRTIKDATTWSCELARISATCKYYADDMVQKGLKETILGIENVLGEADKDERTKVDNFSFKQAHKDWYDEFYQNAIEDTRNSLRDYAELVMGKYVKGYDDLDEEIQSQIKNLRDDPEYRKEVCPMAK